MAAVIELVIVSALSTGLRPITATRHWPLTPDTVHVTGTFKHGVPRKKLATFSGSRREGTRLERAREHTIQAGVAAGDDVYDPCRSRLSWYSAASAMGTHPLSHLWAMYRGVSVEWSMPSEVKSAS